MVAKTRVIGTERLIHLLATPVTKSKHTEQDAHTASSANTLSQTHLTEITRRLRGWGGLGVTHQAENVNKSCLLNKIDIGTDSLDIFGNIRCHCLIYFHLNGF